MTNQKKLFTEKIPVNNEILFPNTSHDFKLQSRTEISDKHKIFSADGKLGDSNFKNNQLNIYGNIKFLNKWYELWKFKMLIKTEWLLQSILEY